MLVAILFYSGLFKRKKKAIIQDFFIDVYKRGEKSMKC